MSVPWIALHVDSQNFFQGTAGLYIAQLSSYFSHSRDIDMTNCRRHLVSCLESKHFLTELVLEQSNELVAIAYHDVKMRRLQSRFPELLLLDATYKLIDLRMPLYALMVVDGNSESVVVGLWIVANEERAIIIGLMDIFIKYKDTDSIKCVMIWWNGT